MPKRGWISTAFSPPPSVSWQPGTASSGKGDSMPCYHIRHERRHAIPCTRGSRTSRRRTPYVCSVCEWPEGDVTIKLWDYPVEKGQTCDAPVCTNHAAYRKNKAHFSCDCAWRLRWAAPRPVG